MWVDVHRMRAWLSPQCICVQNYFDLSSVDAISPRVAAYVVPWLEHLQHLCDWLLCPHINNFWLLLSTCKPHKFGDLVNMITSLYEYEFLLHDLVINQIGLYIILATCSSFLCSLWFQLAFIPQLQWFDVVWCHIQGCMGIQSWRTEFTHFYTVHIMVCTIVRAIVLVLIMLGIRFKRSF